MFLSFIRFFLALVFLLLCFTFSFSFMNNPYLVLFYIFHSVVTRSLFFSLENHRFRSAAALLPNLHSVVTMFVVVSLCGLSCFLRLPCEASVPERRKNLYQTTRDVCSILFFGRQIGWEQRRGGGKETFPTLPLPLPVLSLFVVNSFLVVFVCFCFLCQKLKTWSLFALYSLEILSTLSLSVICLLLLFEGCPSKPLHQSWLTTPFAKMTGVVSTIIL